MSWGDDVIRAMDALCDKFGIAAEFSRDEVIPLLKELARRVAIADGVAAVIQIISVWGGLAILLFCTRRMALKSFDQDTNCDIRDALSIAWVICATIAVVWAIISVFWSCNLVCILAECIASPELRLLKRLMQIGGAL